MKARLPSRLGWLALCVTVAISGRSRQSAEFDAIFAAYRGTEAEAAVVRFAAWSDARVLGEAALPQSQAGDPWAAAALALLHLETGLSHVGFRPDDAHVLAYGRFGGALHQQGDALIAALIPRARASGDNALLRFCRDYYVVLGTALFLPPWANSAWAQEARQRLADDPDVQLLIGTYAAYGMGPRRVGDSPYGVDWGTPKQPVRLIFAGGEEYNADETRQAEVALRKALELDPSRAEARLRLGRVYQLVNRSSDALRELQRAAVDAAATDDRLSGYLAELFLGQLHEEAGRISDATTAYQRAIRLFPAGYVARLALGQLLIAAGKAGEGWAVSRSVFGQEVQPSSRDPWSRYPAPGYWRIADRLAAMRARVSKTPLKRSMTGEGSQTEPDASIRLSPILNEPTVEADMRTPVFRSRVESVRVDALVTQDGRPVSDLQPSDFEVTDNGVRQPLESAAVAKSVAAAIVVDTSQSMSHPENWRLAQTAIGRLATSLTADDTFSVFTASDRLALRGDLLRKPDVLPMLTAAVRPETAGLSTVWDAVLAGGALVAESPGRALVVLISDGWDNASWFHRPRALDRLKRLGLTVDAVGVPFPPSGSVNDVAVGDVSLRGLQGVAGGVVTSATDPDLGRKLADRFAALRQGYILMYTPVNVKPQKDGWHEIKVSLRPGLKGKVEARPGYYAPKK